MVEESELEVHPGGLTLVVVVMDGGEDVMPSRVKN